MHDEIARFQAEIQRLAFAAARAVIAEELARRQAKPEPRRRRKGRPARRADRQLELGLARESLRQLDLPLAQRAAAAAAVMPKPEPPAQAERDSEGAGAPEPVVAPASVTPDPPSSVPAGGRGRVHWTRESIVSELATWMLSGTAIDAQFMTRHGPRGLVAAIRRVFGRFEAALNVAALHNSKLYPEGLPARGTSVVRRPTAAAATPDEPK